MLNTVSIGDLGESYAIMQFTQVQAIVSKPLTNNARYDLIIELNHRLYRIQVKTTNAVKDGKMEFATKTTNYTKGSWKSSSYSHNEVDLFFLYCAENNWCGLYIPTEDVIPQTITIRLKPPKNNQKIGIKLAEEYSFAKQFGALAQMVEQETLNFEVAGSSPSCPTTN